MNHSMPNERRLLRAAFVTVFSITDSVSAVWPTKPVWYGGRLYSQYIFFVPDFDCRVEKTCVVCMEWTSCCRCFIEVKCASN